MFSLRAARFRRSRCHAPLITFVRSNADASTVLYAEDEISTSPAMLCILFAFAIFSYFYFESFSASRFGSY